MSSRLSIIVCNHKDLEREPLHYPYIDVCNVSGEIKPNGYTHYDSDADINISQFNNQYCELSQLYSFWTSNLFTEYFGLCHYRRFFFLQEKNDSSVEINFQSYKDYIYHVGPLESFDYDLIAPNEVNLNNHSIFSQFESIHPNLVPLFEEVCKVFDKNSGFNDSLLWFKNTNLLTPCNMFVAKREIANHWCSILFPTLFEVQSATHINLEGYDLRWAGFISERLFTLYIENFVNKQNVKRYPILFLR